MRFLHHKAPLRLIILILFLLTLSACTGFKHGVYDMAMDMERKGAGLEPATIMVDGFEIALFEGEGRGTRPTLLLIHGFGASKDVWLRFSRELKNEFHIIAIDLPGHGDSSKPMDRNYSIPSQVAYLRGILAEIALPDPPHIAGNSMGGAIATLYAARYPEEIASITLFCPAGVHAHESDLSRLMARGENPLIVNEPGDFSRLLDFSMEQKPFIIWPITSVMGEKAVANRTINNKIFTDSFHDRVENYTAILPTVKVPALIVWGRQDRIINAENGRIFDELIPDSRLVILDDVGHAPMIEVPGISASLLNDFARARR